MPLTLATLGAALLAYVIFLISGVGVAVIGFVGIMLIVVAIYWMFSQMKDNQVTIHNIETNQHYELMRVVYEIQTKVRQL